MSHQHPSTEMDMGHEGMDHGSEMMMHGMVFQNTHTATLLFPGWSTEEGFGYAWMIVICFVAGILAVVFKYLRNEMEMKLFHMTEQKKYERINSKYLSYALANCCRAVAVFIILTWDYFLMLGAMTFNVGIFFAIVSGVACGFLFMGHLFVSPAAIKSSSSSQSTDGDGASYRYPQRVDVACSPQVASLENSEATPAPRAGLLAAVEVQNCACSV